MDIVNSDVAKYITAIPHPFMAVGCPYDGRALIKMISDDTFKRCFDIAAEKGIALELNPNYLRKKEFDDHVRNENLAAMYTDQALRMLRIGKDCGCKFTVGPDCHGDNEEDLDYSYTYLLAGLLDLTEDDFHPLCR